MVTVQHGKEMIPYYMYASMLMNENVHASIYLY